MTHLKRLVTQQNKGYVVWVITSTYNNNIRDINVNNVLQHECLYIIAIYQSIDFLIVTSIVTETPRSHLK